MKVGRNLSPKMLLAIDIMSENPEMGSRAVAKEVKKTFKDVDVEKMSGQIRGYNKRNSKFSDTLKAANFPKTDNWEYGWLKTKEASVFIRNKAEIDLQDIRDTISEAVKSVSKDIDWGLVNTGNPESGNLLVVNIFDLHLGKLAWGEETGEDYDVKIASDRFKTALEDLVQKASGYNVDKIMFPIGNDFFNSDNSHPYPSTTKGTPQADDVRWQKFFRMGIQLMTEAIIRLSRIAPVQVITVFSNHDHQRVFYLGETLAAVFNNKQDLVNVNNSPKVRKYEVWGDCLIGLAHGHNEKAADLPLIMAQEAKEQWASTTYREWLLGHFHSKQKYLTQTGFDYKGVRVTYLTSPSAPDAWHFEKGYIGAIKGAEAFIYNKREGLIGTVCHNIF